MNPSAAKQSVNIVNPQGLMPRGVSDFAELVKQQHCFVDKSLLIQELLGYGDKVVLITRPRRFGKTINLSMLHAFFAPQEGHNGHWQQGSAVAQGDSKGNRSSQQRTQCQRTDLFGNLLIAQDEQAMQHHGKYPVIALTFKNVKKMTWQDAYMSLRSLISQEIDRHPECKQFEIDGFGDEERRQWRRILSPDDATQNDWENALQLLCKLLTLHHKKPPWLLLDEYDTPIHAAYVRSQKNREDLDAADSYYDQAISFMRGLLGTALKGNDSYLHKAVITGILRVAKEDIFSDLNNLGVYGVMDWKFDRHFGFTNAEVQQLFQQRQIGNHLQQAQHWYNGYQLGRRTIYNPWSIVSFISNLPQPAQEYWVNTGSTSLIEHLLETSSKTDQQAIETLLLGDTVQRDVADNLPLRELKSLGQALWSVLLTSGYVTAQNTTVGVLGKLATLRIPNQEVRIAFQRLALQWFNDVDDNCCPTMLQTLLAGDIDGFARHLNTLIACTLSFFDLAIPQSERSYHMFILGLLSHLSGNYKVRSNRESGRGRPDLLLIPVDMQNRQHPGIVMEFKIADSEDQLQQSAQTALEQIEQKKYAAEFQDHPPAKVLKLGIAFCNKKAVVKTGTL
ncbi:MAG: AAA family ATPase [Myxococcota bacterium]